MKLARKYGGFRLLLFQAPEKEKGVFSRIIHKIMWEYIRLLEMAKCTWGNGKSRNNDISDPLRPL
jgi:hypothetical protein